MHTVTIDKETYLKTVTNNYGLSTKQRSLEPAGYRIGWAEANSVACFVCKNVTSGSTNQSIFCSLHASDR